VKVEHYGYIHHMISRFLVWPIINWPNSNTGAQNEVYPFSTVINVL